MPKGFSVRMRVDGEAWMAESLAIVVLQVIGFPAPVNLLITALWSAVSLTESGWVARKEDQLSNMVGS